MPQLDPRVRAAIAACLLLAAVQAAQSSTARPRRPAPADGPFNPIAVVIREAIERHDLPGAVVLVGRGDRVLYRAAFGARALQPVVEPMTVDTVFDVASLTKVVATTTAIMQLVERGRLRLADRASQFVPELSAEPTRAVTIRQLLTHTSGLAPDLDLHAEFRGAAEAIRRAAALPLVAIPGERFVYSDINFFLLGAIVERVSGERLDQYARAHVFDPLGMPDTMFLPPLVLRPRIAPTERCLPLAWPCGQPDTPFLRGVVHDPTARRMGGVAGHAGLFSTAGDLSRFCRMLLGGGQLGTATVLSPASVALMTTAATSGTVGAVYGLGWDIDSSYSSERGDLFPVGLSFGHTGFTGTSLWIDPHSGGYVVFLSNRVHPDGTGTVTALRGRVATIAAAAIHSRAGGTVSDSAAAVAPTLAGIDVLEREGFARLRGKRVGLLTNQTGRTRAGVSTIDAIAHAPGVTLTALFSPEHGIRGEVDDFFDSSHDEATGIPIYSLYGRTLRPTADMLRGLDVLVVDLQDVGTRFYSYPAAVAYVMEEAARRKLPVIVLDRPDPIGGFEIEGPLQEAAPAYTGFVRMPIRHGLTIGELARLFNGEAHIGADLSVVPMQQWRRGEWYDATGLAWVNPSPNMRSLPAATVYPGVGALEGTNVSVGRGTDTPFEQIGAPWIDGPALAAALNARRLPGIRFYPVTFTPAAGAKLGGERCHGVFLVVTDRDALHPVRVALELASLLVKRHGAAFRIEDAAALFGSAAMLARIRAGDDPEAIAAEWRAGEREWRARRAAYLLY